MTATASGNDDDMTIFDILERCGRILLGDEETGRIFCWNGGSEFHVFQHGGKGAWYTVDFWTTSEPPVTLEKAMDRCRERLSLQMAEEAEMERHDADIDARRERGEIPS